MKRMARPECQVCIPESIEQCLACMDEYAAELEKKLAVYGRAWELHDAEFSLPSPCVDYNSKYHIQQAREEEPK